MIEASPAWNSGHEEFGPSFRSLRRNTRQLKGVLAFAEEAELRLATARAQQLAPQTFLREEAALRRAATPQKHWYDCFTGGDLTAEAQSGYARLHADALEAGESPNWDELARRHHNFVDHQTHLLALASEHAPYPVYDDPRGPLFHAPEIDGQPFHPAQRRNDSLCAMHALNAVLATLDRQIVDEQRFMTARESVRARGEAFELSDAERTTHEEFTCPHELSAIIDDEVRPPLDQTTLPDPGAFLHSHHGRSERTQRYAPELRAVESAEAMLLCAVAPRSGGGHAAGHWYALIRDRARNWRVVDSLKPSSYQRAFDSRKAVKVLAQQHQETRAIRCVIAVRRGSTTDAN